MVSLSVPTSSLSLESQPTHFDVSPLSGWLQAIHCRALFYSSAATPPPRCVWLCIQTPLFGANLAPGASGPKPPHSCHPLLSSPPPARLAHRTHSSAPTASPQQRPSLLPQSGNAPSSPAKTDRLTGPVPAAACSSPGDHGPEEVEQQQAEGAQVLRGHGFSVPASVPVPSPRAPHSLRRRRVGSPAHQALRGRLPPGSPPRSAATASSPPPLLVHFPGVPSPRERSPQQARANRCSGHHTRPAPRSQSTQYTSPPRRRGRPVRPPNCSRSSGPIREGNVREPRRRRDPLSLGSRES